jgi:hypothetical protein
VLSNPFNFAAESHHPARIARSLGSDRKDLHRDGSSDPHDDTEKVQGQQLLITGHGRASCNKIFAFT